MFPIGQLAFQEVTMARLDDWGSMVLGHWSTISTCSLPRVHFSRQKQCCCSREIFFCMSCNISIQGSVWASCPYYRIVLFCFCFTLFVMLFYLFSVLLLYNYASCISQRLSIVRALSLFSMFLFPHLSNEMAERNLVSRRLPNVLDFPCASALPTPPPHTHTQWLWNTGLCI